MSTSAPNRVAAGVPTGGQFASKAHDEPAGLDCAPTPAGICTACGAELVREPDGQEYHLTPAGEAANGCAGRSDEQDGTPSTPHSTLFEPSWTPGPALRRDPGGWLRDMTPADLRAELVGADDIGERNRMLLVDEGVMDEDIQTALDASESLRELAAEQIEERSSEDGGRPRPGPAGGAGPPARGLARAASTPRHARGDR
ncbi:hypothetical protein GCM10027053_47370 [Intrasporangium mesophilum]